MLNYFPKYFTDRAIYLYLIALIVVSFGFISHTMNWYWYVFGLVQVVGFFYFSNLLTKKWANRKEKVFTKNLFYVSLTLRVVWVVFSYVFYSMMTGQPFEFSAADSHMYHIVAGDLANRGFAYYESAMWGLGLSDRGYPTYLGVVYMLTGHSIFIARFIKAVLSAFTCVLIYKLTSRSFGESIGRMAGVFSMLMPNLIYYCGLHLKEVEMVFLIVAFIERADFAMRSFKLTFMQIAIPILLAISLFFFRTVLGAAALFAFITALIFSSMATMKKGVSRFVLIIWVMTAIVYFMGGRIATEVEEVWAERSVNQEQSLQWRAQREGGNELAKYASSAVFAPMIMVIPFPTVVDIPNQENQQLIHGGNFVKNVLAFFVMFALFWVVYNKKWRDHLLIVAFTLSYLMIIAFSAFAHSERFHLPALPFLLILAAYGVSVQTNKTKKYYVMYLAFLLVVIIAWSWFKLAGRGMVSFEF